MSTSLDIKDLSVSVGEETLTPILHQVSLSIAPGEIHVLMGPNGAGKSTLGHAIMGNPAYTVTEGTISFHGKDLTDESVSERSKAGLFLSFQNPLEVPGITLMNFLRSAKEELTGEHIRLFAFRKEAVRIAELLQMDPSYLDRDLNVGFSGGEKKKAEILQLLVLNPRLAILDETDSGLDVDAVRVVSFGIEHYMRDPAHSLLVITHSTRILDNLSVDKVHVLVGGQIVANGDASIISDINAHGFEKYQALSNGQKQ